MVYDAPGIFSYFSPDLQPDGQAGKSGLVSPEVGTHSTPGIMALLQGLFDMVKYEFDCCFDGFGQSQNYFNHSDVSSFQW